MTARVICISRAMLTGAENIATDVAKELGYRVVDEEIVARAAHKRDLTTAEVANAEKRKSLLASLLQEISDNSSDVINFISDPKKVGTHDDARQLIREAITETAAEGDVVIVAHAASYALARTKGVLRVLVTGSEFGRVNKWLTTSGGKSPREGQEIVRDSDAARANYLKRFYDVRHEAPEDYDITLSVDSLSPAQIAQLILQAAKAVPQQ
jgi:cytidylate kinase